MVKQAFTDDQLLEAMNDHHRSKDVANALGVTSETVRKRCRQLGIEPSWSRRRYSETEFVAAVASSTSWSGLFPKLGLSKTSGGSFKNLQRYAESLGVSYDHFVGTTHNTGRPARNRKSADQLLVLRPSHELRQKAYLLRRAMNEKGIVSVCKRCGQGTVWCGGTLTLQVDHINGNSRDDRLENLRFLCPNCHTQTSSWGRQKNLLTPSP